MGKRVRRSGQEVVAVLEAVADGATAVEAAARFDVPVGTVRTWLGRRVPAEAVMVRSGAPRCSRCGDADHGLDLLDPVTYAGLLGFYLGDGCLAAMARGGHVLRVTLDEAHPWVIDDAVVVVGAVRGRSAYVLRRGDGAVDVASAWRSWQCLLPQHGSGRKHERSIVLEDWQQRHVVAAPEAFVRALIHTDGWRGDNVVVSKGREYRYPRYQFSNRSDDVRVLFTDALDALGVAWRPWGRWNISVARHEAVAALDAFVGRKDGSVPAPWASR